MNSGYPPIHELLPHRGTMLLLDRVIAWNTDGADADYMVPPDAWYSDTEGAMPGWLGIELMAQAVAAHVSLSAHTAGMPPKRGVLLGTRAYRSSFPNFAAQSRLRISARLVYTDDTGLGAYDCAIRCNDEIAASASLMVYEPPDFDGFVKGGSA